MAPIQSLQKWVQEKYQTVGIDKEGNFIGEDHFTCKLIGYYGGTKGARALDQESWKENLAEIRRLVNVKAYLPPTITPTQSPNPKPSAKAKSWPTSKVTSSSTTAKTPLQPSNPKVKATTSTASNSTAKPKTQPPNPKVNASASTAGNSTTKLGAQPPNPKVNASNHNQVPLNTKMLELVDDTRRPSVQNFNRFSESDRSPGIPNIEHQHCLLDLSGYSESSYLPGLDDNDIRDAVIFQTEVLKRYDSRLLPQYGLLGSICPTKESPVTAITDPRLFLNTNVPFSAFICGLQGSGKSHTISCLLENSLIKAPILGVLQQPLSALVLHFCQYTSRSSFQPCEAAFLAYHHPNFRGYTGVSSIHVMVAPSNYHDLNTSYSYIPGVDIRPFKLKTKHLNISSMLTLMSVDQTETPPLYIGQITKILREIATTSPGEFSYPKFKEAIEACDLTPAQKGPLQQRLDLLESFLDLDNSAVDYSFEAGSITIVDLSCPFVDANTACTLFNICIGMYLESNPTVGKLIAVDEAHKYMTNTPASKALTERLLTVIRLQRHYGARVIISTQEPTISPRLIDLCSIIIIHRFTSPEWFDVVRKHVSISETDKAGLENLFGRIVTLRPGEALLFAPSTILTKREENSDVFIQLSSNLLKAKIRKRLTWDGGKSVFVCKPVIEG